jgi:hypothetical protein
MERIDSREANGVDLMVAKRTGGGELRGLTLPA